MAFVVFDYFLFGGGSANLSFNFIFVGIILLLYTVLRVFSYLFSQFGEISDLLIVFSDF